MINPFQKTYTTKELNLFSFLANVELFKELSHKEMALFIPFMHERDYESDEVVFFRGDPSQALYVVIKGRVTLNIDIKDRFEVLTEVRSNKAFGDNSLVGNTKRIYSAIVASEQANLYVIPQVNIMEIFENEPIIKAKMLQSLAEAYNYYTQRLLEAYKSSFGFFEISQVYKETKE